MLHFVIPFKSKEISKDWKRDSAICIRTIKGLLRQTNDNYTVTLACHQRPEGFERVGSHSKVRLIECPDLWVPPDPSYLNGLRSDRDHKLRIAMASLRNFGKGYIMPVDADDAVHVQLTEFIVNEARGADLYYAEYGYIYDISTGILFKKKRMHHRTGTSLVFRFTADDLPDDEKDKTNPEILVLGRGHLSHKGVVNAALRNNDVKARQIPFPSVCYVVGTGVQIRGAGMEISRTFTDKVKSILKAMTRFWQVRYPGNKWQRKFGFDQDKSNITNYNRSSNA